MNLEELGNLGEFIAAIATLATLVYLALQIRQNTRSVQAQSHHAITDSFNHLNGIVGTDVAAARVLRLGMEGLETLSDDEQASFGFLMLAYMRIFETLYFQRENSVMSDQLYLAEQGSTHWMFSHAGVRDWWNSNEISFSPEFRHNVDQQIAEIVGEQS